MTAEDRIRALIEDRIPATAGKDAAVLSDHYAADAVLFDAVGPLRSAGTAAQAQRVAEWLSAYRGPIDYQIRDLEITAGEQVAFCHYLYRVGGTMTDGTVVGMWLRSTVCLRQAGQDWLVTHEHTSVPFNGATGAASLTLEP
jgi:ketosteroid isomerase-like protein